MTSYILKNNKKSKDILLFEEKESYSFTPKKTYKWVKKVTVLDTEMLSRVWENKINKEYDKLLDFVFKYIVKSCKKGQTCYYFETTCLKENVDKLEKDLNKKETEVK